MARTTIDIEEAASVLRAGGVVGMPTETVYGLAGRIDSPEAIRRIFQIKRRPFFDPLIVHVADAAQGQRVAAAWPEAAGRLAERFWPGPVSLVLPKADHVDAMITAGLPTLAVRMPRHQAAIELICRAGAPLAAPSANKFGRTSPTSAAHVVSEFTDSDLLVVDGGECEVGLESSVLAVDEDEAGAAVRILRPGMVSGSDVSAALSGLEVRIERGRSRASPGHMESHYRPPIPLALVSGAEWTESAVARAVKERLGPEWPQSDSPRVGWMIIPPDPIDAARTLYAQMRSISVSGVDVIAAQLPEDAAGEAWEAIADRLRRAASVRLDAD